MTTREAMRLNDAEWELLLDRLQRPHRRDDLITSDLSACAFHRFHADDIDDVIDAMVLGDIEAARDISDGIVAAVLGECADDEAGLFDDREAFPDRARPVGEEAIHRALVKRIDAFVGDVLRMPRR